MAEEDRFLLSEADSERIFRDRIVPDQLGGTSQERPVAVFVAGQAGDGKASVTAQVKAALASRGRPVVLSPTVLEAYHPRLHEPITDDPATSDRYVQADGLRWFGRAVDLAIDERYDVIVETELVDPEEFATSARRFKAAGYAVEVAILAVSEAVSRLGVLERHIRALQTFGFGRLATQERHEAGYAGVLRAAELIDDGDWVDRVAVLRPDGRLVYGNERAGEWQQPARTADAITWERNRAWTVAESRDFLEATSTVERFGLAAPVQWIRDESVDGAKALMALARPRLDPVAVTLHIAKAGTSSY
ncbi:zeta toxin family protein [Kribbella sp.]|uniref:zeta toxin family protein n=1 Tax=Kribbella sp. TaxID=1871183 RepID=UPI002D7587AC|nr:zeta toxin family protein [Kribbella sp.]HZX06429.1 zeta toxin family protein [Kribbella sp.]